MLALALVYAPLAGASTLDPPDPSGVGPFVVGHTSFEVTDPDRADRRLPVELWYPAAEDAVGPATFYELLQILGIPFGITSDVAIEDAPITFIPFLPLVLFSHGSGGINIQSIDLMEALASHGFVVASPNHTGNSTFDEEGDEPFEDPATDRPKDISFLIDHLLSRSFDPADMLFLKLNPLAIGVAGHSFGGFTALSMAAGYGESAFGPVPPDKRVRAIVPISGATSSFLDSELESVKIPTLFVGGTLDTAVPIDPETVRGFDLIRSRQKYRADVIDATHTHFANICDIAQVLLDLGITPNQWAAIGAGALIEPYEDTCIPPALPLDEAIRLQNLYTVAFFRRHLVVDLRYKPFLTEAYAEANEPGVIFFARLKGHCGLGFELVFLLPPLMWLHRRRRRVNA